MLKAVGIQCAPLPCLLSIRHWDDGLFTAFEESGADWMSGGWDYGVIADENPITRLWDAYPCIEWSCRDESSDILDLGIEPATLHYPEFMVSPFKVAWSDESRRGLSHLTREGVKAH